MRVAITQGRVLGPDGRLVEGTVLMDGGQISAVLPGTSGPTADWLGANWLVWDASGLLVLPGMIDLHGDAFERQIMPRPGVSFPVGTALVETDRHLVANGITTAYHGLTWSWEPGLRGGEAARAFVQALTDIRPMLACDTRLHLRHEIFNLDAEEEILGWLAAGKIDLLAFNDHLDGILSELDVPRKASAYAGRTGLPVSEVRSLARAIGARKDEVPASVLRLAAAAREAGVPMASHDDTSPAQRRAMTQLGAHLCEFPVTAPTARAARDKGETVIMGAPNVLRGGSHCGRLAAADLIGDGLANVLASDYHYPSLLQAVLRLAADDVAYLSDAWALVSENPAEAMGLTDRGVIAPGRRADILLVDEGQGTVPRVMATFVAGRAVHSLLDPAQVCRIPCVCPDMAAE